MFAVGRLGSYISRGVYRVSSPFPLGGAVDIIVVEQQDGSFKSTPWYVRFGKFQGTLTERVVNINVNGVDADFHMYLDHKGDAFFIREVDGDEGDEFEAYVSSGEEMDMKGDAWRSQKSMSCNLDANRANLVAGLEGSPRKNLSRTHSRRARIFGLPIGRRSMNANGFQDAQAGTEADRVASLERAEIAADLLEVRWSTNLRTGKNQNVRSSADNIVVSSEGQGNEEFDEKFSSPRVNTMEFTLEETYMAIHNKSTQNSVGELCDVSNSSSKPSRIVGNEKVEGSASSDKAPNDRDDTQDEVGTSPQCSRGEGFIGDIAAIKKVEEVPLEKFSSAKFFVSDRNDRVTASDDSKEEEQFLFSDLDEPKVEKGEHSKSSSSGSAEWLSPSGSSEDGESNTTILDESHQVTSRPTRDILFVDHPSPRINPNRVSTLIGISKIHSDADVAALVPVVESLPNMIFDDDELPLKSPHPYGRSLDSTLEAFKMVDDDVPLDGVQQQIVYSHSSTDSSPIPEGIRKKISDPAIEVSLCRHSLFEGMGYEAAARAFETEKLDMDKFLSLGRDILKNDKLVVRIGGLYFPWDAALPIASAIGSQGHIQNLEPKGMIAVGEIDDETSEGVARDSLNSRGGSWRMWPFSFNKTNGMQNRNSSSEDINPHPKEMVGAVDTAVPSVIKKKVRAKFPTSEELGSLNLKEGKNLVTFNFSTAMFGEQQVDARIFLWKWNSRIVISDVDGTITKSDVLGQFMPLMGYDWSQTGVAHLFSAIKENGYQLLFLSARSISQAYLTRQFLINLKQDGKALPEGPVLISPDGLFPSLYREVIRRAPHEFKIACLEDVKVLFPEDHNPFYAGFGNRDTDELSYLKVGIPRGKIFTINPKGEVVVNRRVETKSYTSLHTLVHDMFPPTTMHEQEDYNSWNFWRLPPDSII